jgi:hypothetical protein
VVAAEARAGLLEADPVELLAADLVVLAELLEVLLLRADLVVPEEVPEVVAQVELLEEPLVAAVAAPIRS